MDNALVRALVEAFSSALAPVVDGLRKLLPSDVTTGATRAFPVTNAVERIAPKNPKRIAVLIQNASASTIEFGYTRGLQFGQGIQLLAGNSFSDNVHPYTGEYFAIAGVAGPLDVRVSDVSSGEREQ